MANPIELDDVMQAWRDWLATAPAAAHCRAALEPLTGEERNAMASLFLSAFTGGYDLAARQAPKFAARFLRGDPQNG